MKALVGAFNQEKALVGAFSVIVQPVVEPMEHYTALQQSAPPTPATSSLCEITRCTPHLFLPIFWFVSRELSSLVSEWKSGTMSPGRCKYNTKERQRQLSKDWIQIIQWRLFLCQNHGWELFLNFLFTVFLGRKFSDQTQVMISCRINTKLLIRDTKGVSGLIVDRLIFTYWLFDLDSTLFPTTWFLFTLVQTEHCVCLLPKHRLAAGWLIHSFSSAKVRVRAGGRKGGLSIFLF